MQKILLMIMVFSIVPNSRGSYKNNCA